MDLIEKRKQGTYVDETTHKRDYKRPSIVPEYSKIRWLNDQEENVKVYHRKPAKNTCHETLTELRPGHYIPFNLCWKHRPIIEPPENNLQHFKESNERKTSQANSPGPKEQLCPSVNLNDPSIKEQRDLIINYMYTTDTRRAMQVTQDLIKQSKEQSSETLKKCSEIKEDIEMACCPSTNLDKPNKMPAKENTTLKEDAEQRKAITEWDNKQLRKLCNRSCHFWSEQPPTKSNDGKDPLAALVSQETMNQLSDLLDRNKLRQAADTPMQGYAGYKPQVVQMDSFKRKDFPQEHPMVTTYQIQFNKRN